jgi:hypothetical protein
MRSFKEGDKVKVIKASLPSFWYADKIGSVFTLRRLASYDNWAIEEDHTSFLNSSDIELVEEELSLVLEEHPLESYPSKDKPDKDDGYSVSHYDNYYTLTEEDIEAGQIKVDAYWVAKQWKTGSRDDSGALWHSLKTIARFGDKNSVDREIKALYNQAKALARIYKVDLE